MTLLGATNIGTSLLRRFRRCVRWEGFSFHDGCLKHPNKCKSTSMERFSLVDFYYHEVKRLVADEQPRK